jgi:hypothetical protein
VTVAIVPLAVVIKLVAHFIIKCPSKPMKGATISRAAMPAQQPARGVKSVESPFKIAFA